VPDGLVRARFYCWARWARFFIAKNEYYNGYSIFTSILPLSMAQGWREWMDAAVDGLG
jgi:hypothetical protein